MIPDVGHFAPKSVRSTIRNAACLHYRIETAYFCAKIWWEERAAEAQGQIWDSIEPHLERLRYEYEIARRVLAQAPDETAQTTWQTQVDVLYMMIGRAEGDLAEQQAEVALCEAMIAEIEADLAQDVDESIDNQKDSPDF